MKYPKGLLLAGAAAMVTLFFALDLGRYLQLDYLKAGHSHFSALYAQYPAGLRGAYFAAYVAVAALSLPGAAILTLAGGAVFGLGWGLLLTSFASSLGATLAFLMARYALRDAVQARFQKRLADINRGMARDGALYLLGLRLVPLVPFVVINLAMGLTTMRVWTYYWVSQLGMLAGTAVYVNAGTQLAHIKGLQDVVSPGLLASFPLLGVFPLLARRMLDAVQRRKVYARWKAVRPTRFDRNLIVIGAGAGGLVSAYIAAAVKARVTLVEAHKMGGDCLNYGCVPSKTLIRSARLAHQMRHAERYGLRSTTHNIDGGYSPVDFKKIMQRIHDVVAAIAPHDSVERYTGLGVDVVQGHARIINPWTVEITPTAAPPFRLTTRSIIIAAGASPVVPALPGLDKVAYVTSDTLWERFAQLDTVPRRLLVLGGGPIGCELAQAFARLGSTVTLVDMAPRLLAREDAEVSALVAAALLADGVQVLTAHDTVRVERTDPPPSGHAPGDAAKPAAGILVVEQGGVQTRIAFDQLLCAVGRCARLTGYGLEELGIPTDSTVQTNDYLQTLYPNIYAAGDVAGPYQFTHTAAHQAWYASVNALFGDFKRFRPDYSAVPSATFVDPEVARVGLNEQDAKAQAFAFEVTRFDLDDLDRQICDAGPGNPTHGFVKVLTVPGKDTILGVTIVGNHAAELLAEYVLAMQHGLGLNKILGTIHSYPTLAEANQYAAGAWKRAHAPLALLEWVRKFHDWRRS